MQFLESWESTLNNQYILCTIFTILLTYVHNSVFNLSVGSWNSIKKVINKKTELMYYFNGNCR